jgi:multiple sugar transport system substrate-binding protein
LGISRDDVRASIANGDIVMKPCLFTVSVACALLATFASAPAADLTIWWEKGYYPEEDKAIEAVVSDFEQKSGKHVELTLYPQEELPGKIASALEAGRPPDLAYSLPINEEQLAYDDALADLTDIVEPVKDTFYPAALQAVLLTDGKTGQRAYYGVPIGQSTVHIHVWKSLLDQAGIRLQDIPKDWEPFWAFWCDTVQPAVRKATGRNDIYGVGLTLSDKSNDTGTNFWMFVHANGADYVTRDGKLVIDDPDVQAKLVKALDELATIYRKGCTPPDSVNWHNPDNNKQFHAQRIVMTVNDTLSITNALRADRPDDYYKNTVTIQWPNGSGGKPPAIENSVYPVLVFKDAQHATAAKEFLGFMLSEGRLGGFIQASLGRVLPPMPALLETPFWQDPKDPHRSAAIMQIQERTLAYSYVAASGNVRNAETDPVWAAAVRRVAEDDYPADKAVEEAVAQVKKILAQ